MQGRFEGVSVKEREIKQGAGRFRENRQRGFSVVELCVVVALILVISAIAITSLRPAVQDANCDTAMRQVISQLRQAREYAITNRRYVQVTFPVVAGQPEIVMTQRDDLTAGAGLGNPILSTIPIHNPESFLVFPICRIRRTPTGIREQSRSKGLTAGRWGACCFKATANSWTAQHFNRSTERCSWVLRATPYSASDYCAGRHGTRACMEDLRKHVDAVLKEIGTMWETKKRRGTAGFTLMETMVALVVLGVGVLGLAAMLAEAIAYMHGSQRILSRSRKRKKQRKRFIPRSTRTTRRSRSSRTTPPGIPRDFSSSGRRRCVQPGRRRAGGDRCRCGTASGVHRVSGSGQQIGDRGRRKGWPGRLHANHRDFAGGGLPNSLHQVVITGELQSGRFQRAYTLTTYVSAF